MKGIVYFSKWINERHKILLNPHLITNNKTQMIAVRRIQVAFFQLVV